MKTFPQFIKTDENKVDWFRIIVLLMLIVLNYNLFRTWKRVDATFTSALRAEIHSEKGYDKVWDIHEKLFELERGINEAGNYAASAEEAAKAAKRSAAFCEG